jgi:hypothetical protein
MPEDPHTLPDFLIIDAPKSGTWWLASRMKKHPQVFLARGEHSGEVKYFTKYFHRPLSYYSDLFKHAGDQIKGEKSPHYCTLSESRIQFIRDLMPKVRLILILRDPVERAWSESLVALLRNTGRQFEQLREAELTDMLNKVQIKYSVVIDNWLKYFSEDQLHICFFDDIMDDPTSLLRNVFRHIGAEAQVDYQKLGLKEIINRGMQIPLRPPYRDYLYETYASEIDTLHQRFGEKIRPWIANLS